ncbi:MAG: glycosyltransferase [Methanobacterium sp.]
MTQKKIFLILTLDAGFGHRRAASAIQNAMIQIHGNEVECKLVNPIKGKGLSSIVQKTQVQYDDASRNHREIYNTVFNVLNHYLLSLMADHAVTQLFIKEITETILDECPDGIISTFPLFGTAIRRILFILRLRIPFYSVVTDLDDVHRSWFHPGPDKYFVASEQLKLQAVECGISPEKVVISGIPVDTQIASETRDKTTIRQQLGWDSDLPTLVGIGSKRVQNLLKNMVAVDECSLPLQLCIVAGGDDELFKAISTRDWKNPIHCYNFVENVPEMLLASDILITKAGGLITSEGLACGLPMLIIDSISGQETGNVNYLLSNNAAVVVGSNDDLKCTLNLWLMNDHHLMDQYAQNAKRIGKPEAAYFISNNMIDDMRDNKYQLKNRSNWKKINFVTSFYR